MGVSDIFPTMKTAALVLAFALGVSADGLGGHSHAHAPGRHGRQEEAPLDNYAQPAYGDLDTAASDASDPLAMLQGSIPGVPGEDYPIYAEVTMLMVRLSVKSSTSAQLMEQEVLLSTASSVPTARFSTRTISSATGGSTLIVPKPRVFSPSMTRLLPNELKLTELLLMPLLLMLPHLMQLPIMLLQLNQLLTMLLQLNMVKLALPDRDRSLAGTVEEAKSRFPLLLFLDVLYY